MAALLGTDEPILWPDALSRELVLFGPLRRVEGAEITGLVGICTDPKHVILYTSNNEVRQEFSIVLTAWEIGGEPTPSSESTEVTWMRPKEAADLAMDRSMRRRLARYLDADPAPFLG